MFGSTAAWICNRERNRINHACRFRRTDRRSTYIVSAASIGLSVSTANGCVNVTSQGRLQLEASSDASWLTVKAGHPGGRQRRVSFHAKANSGTYARMVLMRLDEAGHGILVWTEHESPGHYQAQFQWPGVTPLVQGTRHMRKRTYVLCGRAIDWHPCSDRHTFVLSLAKISAVMIEHVWRSLRCPRSL